MSTYEIFMSHLGRWWMFPKPQCINLYGDDPWDERYIYLYLPETYRRLMDKIRDSPVDMVNIYHYLRRVLFMPGGWPWDF